MDAAASTQPQHSIPGLVKTAAGVVGVVGSVIGILVSVGLLGGHEGGAPTPSVIKIDTAAPATETAPVLDRYEAPQFSLRYPRGWRISSHDTGAAGSSETTIASRGAPGVLVRVDVSRGTADAQATVAARALTAAALNPGYRKLALGVTSIAGFDGARWDYLVREHGVELHRTEVVFTDSRGNGYALVEQAPSAVFAHWQRTFDDVRESLLPGAA
jgi:hypothetical protein